MFGENTNELVKSEVAYFRQNEAIKMKTLEIKYV